MRVSYQEMITLRKENIHLREEKENCTNSVRTKSDELVEKTRECDRLKREVQSLR